MAAWALVLPVLKRLMRLETLARVMWTDRSRDATEGELAKIVTLSQVLMRHRPPRSDARCYERSLLAYRFLAERGADPRLVVALKSESAGMAGHAWVTVAGEPVGETEPLTDFVPLVVYGAGGRREE
jgi:hypothetical protein